MFSVGLCDFFSLISCVSGYFHLCSSVDHCYMTHLFKLSHSLITRKFDLKLSAKTLSDLKQFVLILLFLFFNKNNVTVISFCFGWQASLSPKLWLLNITYKVTVSFLLSLFLIIFLLVLIFYSILFFTIILLCFQKLPQLFHDKKYKIMGK